MNKKTKLALVTLLLLSLFNFSGCNNSDTKNTTAKNVTNDSKTAQSQTVQQVSKKSLSEEGYTYKQVTASLNDGISTIKLDKNGQEYYGVLDTDFNWLIKPSDNILKIGTFVDGIAPAAIAQTNPILLSGNSPQKYLWGYINKKGEWVIKPQYRSAGDFSDGVAIVTTIEKDRDDLSGRKIYVIDEKGNRLFEMGAENLPSTSADAIGACPATFTNGYFLLAYNDNSGYINVLYDKKGNQYPLKSISGLPDANTDDVIFYGAYKNYVIFVDKNTDNRCANRGDYVFNTDTNKASKMEENPTGETKMYFDGQNAGTYDKGDGKLYDFDNKVVGNAITPKYTSSKLWNRIGYSDGKEYYVFYDETGKVIIDESKKIKGINCESTNGLAPSVVKVKIRPSSDSATFEDYLLNFVSLKTISIKELMKK